MLTKREAERKYKAIVDELTSTDYEFAMVYFSNGLQEQCTDGYVDSETKRIIDFGMKEDLEHST